MDVSATTASQSRDEFLQLLVAQLRNQDPLQPVKQEDFLAQLAQFSTLEGVEKLNQSVESQVKLQQDALWMNQLSQASSLIGREVSFLDAERVSTTGVVSSVQISNGELNVVVDGKPIDVGSLTLISQPSTTAAAADTADDAAETGQEPTDAGDGTEVTQPFDEYRAQVLSPINGAPINSIRRIAASRT